MDNLILKSFIPEIFFSVALLFLILFNIRETSSILQKRPIINYELLTQFFFLFTLVLSLLLSVKIEGVFSNFLLLNDTASLYIKVLFFSLAIFLLVPIWHAFVCQQINFFEFFILLSFILLASLLLISCFDLLTAYLGLELQALCLYTLAGIKRDSIFSTEAAIKYFIIGSFFSCIFLFGTLLLYGEFGTVNFYILRLLTEIPQSCTYTNSLLFGCSLILITFFFKLALVPFHFWAPIVYDGAPFCSTIILVVLPKFVLGTFLIRFLLVTPHILKDFEFMFYIVGTLSIICGTFYALRQTRVKKLFIYSSIVQLGFFIIALSTLSEETIQSLYFFFIVYNITATLGWSLLTAILLFQKKVSRLQSTHIQPLFISDLAQLIRSSQIWGLFFLFYFFSLAGLPPLLGFLGKFYLLLSIFKVKNCGYIIVLLLITAISTFYYIRVIKVVLFEGVSIKEEPLLYKGTFDYSYKDIFTSLLSFLLFSLFFFFFYPMSIFLISTTIACGFI